MTPNDYFKVAEKHLKFCKEWVNKMQASESSASSEELLVIFYLSGYIVESLIIFLLYRFGPWDPTGKSKTETRKRAIKKEALNSDMKNFYDPVFTHFTKYDYYQSGLWRRTEKNKNGEGKKAERTVYRLLKSKFLDGNIIPKVKSDENEHIDSEFKYLWIFSKKPKIIIGNKEPKECIHKDSEIGPDELKNKHCVIKHGFQDVIKDIINEKFVNNVEGFHFDFISSFEGMHLLKCWNPEVRYYDSLSTFEKETNTHNLLNQVSLISLLDEISNFYQEIKIVKTP